MPIYQITERFKRISPPKQAERVDLRAELHEDKIMFMLGRHVLTRVRAWGLGCGLFLTLTLLGTAYVVYGRNRIAGILLLGVSAGFVQSLARIIYGYLKDPQLGERILFEIDADQKKISIRNTGTDQKTLALEDIDYFFGHYQERVFGRIYAVTYDGIAHVISGGYCHNVKYAAHGLRALGYICDKPVLVFVEPYMFGGVEPSEFMGTASPGEDTAITNRDRLFEVSKYLYDPKDSEASGLEFV